jgi:hypothetical protein
VEHLKNVLGILILSLAVAAGLAIYLFRHRTPSFAYQAMIRLFCLTRGRSNDVLSWLIGHYKRPVDFEAPTGVLGHWTSITNRRRIVAELREKGYFVFESCLPAARCDRLLQFALSHPAAMRPMDGGAGRDLGAAIYRRGEPQVVRYEFEPELLVRNPDIQLLLADLTFAALAQDYLGARPVIDLPCMWWHTDYSSKPDSEAAQYFHFDMDRPKWVKFFIYLTDVTSENGPHSFVAGSHRTGAIPHSLLKQGYARLSDKEVEAAFERRDIVEFQAPRGTIIVEDTRGLHKALHVQGGDRLMLELNFCNAQFGANYPRLPFGAEICADLQRSRGRFPALYSGFLQPPGDHPHMG